MRTRRSYQKPLVRLSDRQLARLHQQRDDDILRLYLEVGALQKIVGRMLNHQIDLHQEVVALQTVPACESAPGPVRYDVH